MQSLEGRVAQEAVARDCAILDGGGQLWSHPCGLGLANGVRQRRPVDDERLEQLAQLARGLLGEPGPRLADVDE